VVVLDAIQFNDVTVTYRASSGGAHTVLRNFDLRVRNTEFLSIVGPSGCGKSTLLRLAAQLIQPTSGTLEIQGDADLRGFSKVAIVFQRPNLLRWLSVLDNVLYPVRVLRRVTAADRDRALALLETVGLTRFANGMPEELSGGMQQRAAICRALVLDPQILLMDEPFSALDALTREEMQFELRRIHEATLKTTLFVTHSVNEAVLLSDRIAVMSSDGGKLHDICDINLRERSEDSLTSEEFGVYAKRIRDGIYGRPRTAKSAPQLETEASP